MPQSYKWIGTTSTAFGTGTNWSPNGVPANGDSITFDASATRAIAGSDQSAITLASLTVSGMPFAIGSSGTRLKIGAATAAITAGGGVTVALDFASTAVAITVYGDARGGASGLEPVLLATNNAAASLTVNAGVVGLATVASDTATIGAVSIAGGVCNLGSGATVTSVTVTGGSGSATCSLPTLSVANGVFTVQGTAVVTTLTCTGGAVNLNNRPSSGNAVTTLNLYGGAVSAAGDSRPIAIGTLNLRSGVLTSFLSGQFVASTTTLDPGGKTTLNLTAQ